MKNENTRLLLTNLSFIFYRDLNSRLEFLVDNELLIFSFFVTLIGFVYSNVPHFLYFRSYTNYFFRTDYKFHVSSSEKQNRK